MMMFWTRAISIRVLTSLWKYYSKTASYFIAIMRTLDMSPGQDLKYNPPQRQLDPEPWPWIFALRQTFCYWQTLHSIRWKIEERDHKGLVFNALISYQCHRHTSHLKCSAALEMWLVVAELFNFPWYLKDNLYCEKCISNTLTFQCIEVLHFHGLNFSENQIYVALPCRFKHCDARVLCVNIQFNNIHISGSPSSGWPWLWRGASQITSIASWSHHDLTPNGLYTRIKH